MGKKSRNKREQRSWLDEPAFKPTDGTTITPEQRELLEQYREWAQGLDLPPGKPVPFAPMPTNREVIAERRSIVDEMESPRFTP